MVGFPVVVILWLLCNTAAFVPPAASTPNCGSSILAVQHCANEMNDDGQQKDMQESNHVDSHRRDLISSMVCLGSVSLSVRSCLAMDGFDEQIPLSALSKQIRKGAVRGAQVIDKIDGRWERFSDDFRLGEARNRPKVDKLNKVVSGGSISTLGENQVKFNEKLASALLQECDLVFLDSFNQQQSRARISSNDLSFRVDEVKKLVKKSFFPSPDSEQTTEEEYNFEVYSHFKSYNDILIEQNLVFPPFYAEFERGIGKRIVESILPTQPLSTSLKQITDQLDDAFQAVERIGAFFVVNGFIRSWERSVPSEDDIEDFTQPYIAPAGDNFSVTPDLQFTIALEGDVTLKSQLLLQELGCRLYPSFAIWGLQRGLLACFSSSDQINKQGSVSVNIDDYYMDTSYNSNPDLFEVRQILLNVVLQLN